MKFSVSPFMAAVAASVFLAGCAFIPENGDTRFYGLIIGISDYVNFPKYPDGDLQYCDDDAMALYSELLAHGWETGEITSPLIDWSATKAAIISAIASIASSATDKDFIFLYYSGHGTAVPDQDGDEADGNDEAIVPADYDPAAGGPLILDDELRDILKGCRTEKGLIIFDSCNSGGVINKGILTGSAAPYGVLPRTISAGSLGARGSNGQGSNGDLDILNFPVFAASGQDELSWEDSALAHGLFTYFVLGGLDNLSADANGDGKVSVRELFGYAEIHTESYAELRFFPQHPQIRFSRDFIDILVTR
jgi:hypothetical protein